MCAYVCVCVYVWVSHRVFICIRLQRGEKVCCVCVCVLVYVSEAAADVGHYPLLFPGGYTAGEDRRGGVGLRVWGQGWGWGWETWRVLWRG